jgi:RNA recognition motif-containing protein
VTQPSNNDAAGALTGNGAGSIVPEDQEVQGMSRKIYVGNLNYATTDDSVKELFQQFGPVESATVIIDKATGRTRGFGFVEMGSEEAARTAIQKLDGREFEGRRLRVNAAQEKPKRPS